MKNNHPTVTIGIYVFNGMPYIKDALQSIVDQTHKVDQIVISDNCSTDNTLETVHDFMSKHPDYDWKINVNPSNLGFVENAKKVVEMASADYLLMLHADDILKNDTIEKQMRFFCNHPALALIGGHQDSINANGELIKQHIITADKIYQKGDIYTFIKETNSYLPFSTVMHKMNVLERVGFDWESKIADELYWPKVLKSYSIAKLGAALAYRRYHPQKTTYTYRYDFETSKIEIKRHLKVADYQPERKKEIRDLLTYRYSNRCIGAFINCLIKGKIKLSLKYLMLGTKIDNYAILRNIPLFKRLFNRLKM